MSPQRIQRKRTKGWRMPEGAVYVGRGSKFGNPFEYLTPQGLVRYRPEAPEEWEYEGRISAHGATHPYYGPDGTVTDYRVRYATRGELVRMYRRTILDPDRGMLGAYPSNGGHLLTYWTGKAHTGTLRTVTTEEWEIHGVLHTWQGWTWSVPFDGCPVAEWAEFNDLWDGVDGPGRYEVDADWNDDTECYLTVVGKVDADNEGGE